MSVVTAPDGRRYAVRIRRPPVDPDEEVGDAEFRWWHLLVLGVIAAVLSPFETLAELALPVLMLVFVFVMIAAGLVPAIVLFAAGLLGVLAWVLWGRAYEVVVIPLVTLRSERLRDVRGTVAAVHSRQELVERLSGGLGGLHDT
ncbi:MAG: hypothetical protein EDR02_03785 [Actinobacteria bacterium]|nr:MAG: hypothetical protein EDR02_03785 [Actinomycetota bacterium]